MVVVVIVSVGIFGAYQVVNSGRVLATTTENRIEAISIAREGIEIVQNIRDTNWIKFSSDYLGCFDTLNYDTSCIGSRETGSTLTPSRIGTGSYVLNRTGNLWQMTSVTPPGSFIG